MHAPTDAGGLRGGNLVADNDNQGVIGVILQVDNHGVNRKVVTVDTGIGNGDDGVGTT
jgi:hypothetical protein